MKRTNRNVMVTESQEYKELDDYVKALESMMCFIASHEEDKDDRGVALVHVKHTQKYFDNKRRKLCGE